MCVRVQCVCVNDEPCTPHSPAGCTTLCPWYGEDNTTQQVPVPDSGAPSQIKLGVRQMAYSIN